MLVAFSVMADGDEDRVCSAVGALAGLRGLSVAERHRADTTPFPSAAVELRPAADGSWTPGRSPVRGMP